VTAAMLNLNKTILELKERAEKGVKKNTAN